MLPWALAQYLFVSLSANVQRVRVRVFQSLFHADCKTAISGDKLAEDPLKDKLLLTAYNRLMALVSHDHLQGSPRHEAVGILSMPVPNM